jgi:AraC-like DNA-binding protein
MTAIHRAPEKAWSVESLAKEAGMSRSGFSARFTDLVGDSVMRYLTQWRMRLARSYLLEQSEPLSLLAERLGYQSEAAFCRAFKREFGVSPSNVRKSATIQNESTGGHNKGV